MMKWTVWAAAAAILGAMPAWAQEEIPAELPAECEFPGLVILTDPEGDAGDPLLQTVPNPLPQHDMLEMTLAQGVNADGEPRLVFRLRNAGFTIGQPLPRTDFYSSFVGPLDVVRGVRLATDELGSVSFFTYVASGSLDTGDGGTTDGRFVEEGTERPADPASTFTSDGDILIVVDPQELKLQNPGDQLTRFNAASVANLQVEGVGGAAGIWDAMPDGLGRAGSFTFQDPEICNTDVLAPAAKLNASHRSGTTPLTVQFDASGSESRDGSRLSYSFDFGDGTPVQRSPLPVATHTYLRDGEYQALLMVEDAAGRTATATVPIAAGIVPAESRAADAGSRGGGGSAGLGLLLFGGLLLRRRSGRSWSAVLGLGDMLGNNGAHRLDRNVFITCWRK